jgi:transcriptional regulator with XRE-family HTH domain
MPTTARSLRLALGNVVARTRRDLGWSQGRLAVRAGVSRSMIARVESATVNVSLDVAAGVCDALGVQVDLTFRTPFIAERPQRDPAHARCSSYVQHRLEAVGWTVAREVEVVHGRSHGWIDLLAFEPRLRSLLIVEVKTELDDLGRIERTLSWYERDGWGAARRLLWRPARMATWLLVLATDVNDERIRANRDLLARAFEARAVEGLAALTSAATPPHRLLALIDPRSRRRDWLIRCRIDGRRSLATYPNYAAFMRRSSRRQTSRPA